MSRQCLTELGIANLKYMSSNLAQEGLSISREVYLYILGQVYQRSPDS